MSDEFDDFLSEIFEKSFISICFFSLKRFLMVGLSYLIIIFSGASVYGIISVFIRIQEVVRRLSYGAKSSYAWSFPRYDNKKHIGIIMSLTGFIFILWLVTFTLLFYFRFEIIEYTVVSDSSLVILFSLGLLPYLMLVNTEYISLGLRNIRFGMLVSRVFVPGCIILGSAFAFFIIGSSEVSWIWSLTIFFFLLFSSFSIYYLWKSNNFSSGNYDWSIIKGVLSYCLKTTGLGLLSLGQMNGTYVLMALYLSPVTAGLFSLSLVLGKLSRWFLSGINTIIPPIISNLYSSNRIGDINSLYKSTSKVATIGCCIVSMPLVIYHVEILTLFSPEYSSNAFSMIFVVFGQIVATFVGSVGLMLLMTSNEKETLYLQSVQTLITLPIMIYLTINYGILGLSVSFFFSLSFNNLTQLGLLYYLEGLNPITIYHILSMVISSLIVIISYYTKIILSFHLSIIVFLFLVSIFFVISYKLFFTDVEKKSFAKAMSEIVD
jgi:O-antigen/teichoic acid export membrane protein